MDFTLIWKIEKNSSKEVTISSKDEAIIKSAVFSFFFLTTELLVEPDKAGDIFWKGREDCKPNR